MKSSRKAAASPKANAPSPSVPRSPHDIRSIAANFKISGKFISAIPYGNGHINDTYAGIYETKKGVVRYIHQRINHLIFKDPVALVQNIARVTTHQFRKLRAAGFKDTERRALTIIPSRNGHAYYQDDDGNTWRTYIFIEKASTYDLIVNTEQARQAARAFGEFQKMLTDLPGKRLHETIPDFHNTPKRLEALAKAIEVDFQNRSRHAKPEIDFILQRKALTSVLIDKQKAGVLPERVTHNDTKLNNVMLDDRTMEGICVIDLDTVMPGLVLHDFGDMVRTATSPCAEDERDLSRVRMQMPMFTALVDGYLSSTHTFLTASEREYLVFSSKLIALETSIRFLTDFLEGDRYFKIQRREQNLDRCRTQLRLVESIENQEQEMNEVVRSWHLRAPISLTP